MKENSIRKAIIDDIPDLVKLRRIMFEYIGYTDPKELEKGDSSAGTYFYDSIRNETFIGWVAENRDGLMVSSIGVVIDQHPPGPGNLSGKIAYVMNLCTLPDYRKQGIARLLIQKVIEWINYIKFKF